MLSSDPIIMEDDRRLTIHFDSVLDLIHYEGARKNSSEFARFMGKHGGSRGSAWFGPTNTNARQVLDHALLGDEVLYDSLKEKINMLRKDLGLDTVNVRQRIQKVERQRRFGKFGDELDIHKVYAGKLDTAWERRVRVEVDHEHHLVTLHIDVGDSQNVDARDSLWRAAVTLKIYEDLMHAGKSVKIIAGGVSASPYRSTDKWSAQSVTIKDYNESLSMERLAAMSHVGFYRVFGLASKTAQNRFRCKSSMGYSMSPNEDNVSLNIQQEIKAGHTKLVFIGKSSSLHAARSDLEKVYAQLQSMSAS